MVHHYTQTNTNNVNKTRAFLQTTGGRDEPNIVFKKLVFWTQTLYISTNNIYDKLFTPVLTL